MSAAAETDLPAATALELGGLLNVTARRIRQLAEDGRLRRTARGQFDVAHAVYHRIGAAALGQDAARGVPADVLAAVGWLSSFTGRRPTPVTSADVAAWRTACARWGLDGDDGCALLIAAAALMGPRAPTFEGAK